ncbi:putative anaphase-promoting complex subunit 10 protein [Phaeoacremonium minimum UCRPA7]|uniref:Putative anaphase-promoting complex subunit 10 protein n=1 Tax=Phaeoacremonium minimum (strain UCR-PA7) TaxID=1286976 RepID=R8BBT5_PHAM7|nr:putative anaphase-promoting complex subunit 10 protein [Phaeoacremonium minimum UCRPA7]EON96755.1 putative anaphase-promoting complex subunit 10 protein [Phaeoacremonium minimum UCRPA7]
MVEIRALRFFVDYNQDESYTPTHILWFAGTGEHNLIQFAESTLTNPSGWQDVQVEGSGGGSDGNSLCAFVVQMQVKENHQNGKDTHIRGIKVYGFDERADPGEINAVHEMSVDIDAATDRATTLRLEDDDDEEALFHHRVESIGRSQNAPRYKPGEGGLSVPDFMQDPIIR